MGIQRNLLWNMGYVKTKCPRNYGRKETDFHSTSIQRWRCWTNNIEIKTTFNRTYLTSGLFFTKQCVPHSCQSLKGTPSVLQPTMHTNLHLPTKQLHWLNRKKGLRSISRRYPENLRSMRVMAFSSGIARHL